MNQINDSFSFPRFGMVLKKYVSENWRQLAMGVGLVFGVMIIGECLIAFANANDYSQDYLLRFEDGERITDPLWRQVESLFFFMLFILGSVCASMAFSGLGSKEKRIYSLMFPADQLEKYAVRFLIYVISFYFVYMAAFYVGELVRLAVLSGMDNTEGIVKIMPMSYIFTNYKTGEIDTSNVVSVVLFLAVQSAFVLGSTLFPKGTFVRTFVAGGVLLALFFFSLIGISMWLTPENYRSSPLSTDQSEIMIYCIFGIVILFNYILAYYRFKEMEVVNRW